MAKGGSVLIGTVLPIAVGGAAGVLLNDAWEGALSKGVPLPGYGQKVALLGKTEDDIEIWIGMDDVYQVGLSGFVTVMGHFMGSALVKNLGIGMVAGWALVKAGEFQPTVKAKDNAGEYFHNPITLIPHRYPPSPVSTASATSNAVSSAYFVNAP